MTLSDAWSADGPLKRRLALVCKRLIDVIVSGSAMVLLSPLFVAIAGMIRAKMGTPVFFRQERIGFKNRRFQIVKFRTMTDERNERGELLPDEDRLTPVGRFLREHTLDELPELINVFRGEMSIVGPRPLLAEYDGVYSDEEKRRHEMPPGMAGPVLASGRNQLSWEEKFRVDLEYVDNWSLGLDAQLFIKTVHSVLTREGVSAAGHATAPPFGGSTSKQDGGGSGPGESAIEGGRQ